MEKLNILSLIQHISTTFQRTKSLTLTKTIITNSKIPGNLIPKAHEILQIITIIVYKPLIQTRIVLREIHLTNEEIVRTNNYTHLPISILRLLKLLYIKEPILPYYQYTKNIKNPINRYYITTKLEETFPILYIHTIYPNILPQITTNQITDKLPDNIHHLRKAKDQLIRINTSLHDTLPRYIPHLYPQIHIHIHNYLTRLIETLKTQITHMQTIIINHNLIQKFQ